MGGRKTVHLLRHAQASHNIARSTLRELQALILKGGWRHTTLVSLLHLWTNLRVLVWCYLFGRGGFDPHLTPTGWQQVAKARHLVAASGIDSSIQLVVVSPMTRTLETAAGVFGNGTTTANSGPGAISSPHFVAVELCREHIAVSAAHRRGAIRSYKQSFPGVDFSPIQDDEDALWRPEMAEPNAKIQERAKAFVQWLMSRREEEIAVVSHSVFIHHLLRQLGTSDDVWLENCEMYTITLDTSRCDIVSARRHAW